MVSAAIDITGKRFGHLVAIQAAGSTPRGMRLWLCACDCGNETMVAGAKLRNGHTRSCGCIKSVGAQQTLKAALSAETDDCIPWPHGKRVRGYGVIALAGKPQLVPRLVCFQVYGPPQDDRLMALHSCDNPSCINPRHLRWGTQTDNMYDMWDRGRHPRRREAA
jgi:hypothetical protein